MKFIAPLLLAAALVWPNYLAAQESEPYTIAFSQEVVAIDSSGTPYPMETIDPQKINGMLSHHFDLGKGRELLIKTNLKAPEERGLSEIADIINRCYSFLEDKSGGHLEKGVLLYLIEVDEKPLSYSFCATYSAEARWSEVRMAFIEKGSPLTGPFAPQGLTDLLYDTIPHELTHDILADIPNLLHDIDDQPSYHTRWFIDGICELMAKNFARQENPLLLRRFLSMRNVGTVMSDPLVQQKIFSWAQHNANQMSLESDLYGAALLLMTAWTDRVALPEILSELASRPDELGGAELVSLMKKTTNLSKEKMLFKANAIGQRLDQEIYLADRKTMESGWGG